jgi:hypothetical protein
MRVRSAVPSHYVSRAAPRALAASPALIVVRHREHSTRSGPSRSRQVVRRRLARLTAAGIWREPFFAVRAGSGRFVPAHSVFTRSATSKVSARSKISAGSPLGMTCLSRSEPTQLVVRLATEKSASPCRRRSSRRPTCSNDAAALARAGHSVHRVIALVVSSRSCWRLPCTTCHPIIVLSRSHRGFMALSLCAFASRRRDEHQPSIRDIRTTLERP